jgi:hypothetical protein
MTDEERDAEQARLQRYKDSGLIHDFEVRDDDVLVMIRGYVGQVNVGSDAANRIMISTHRVV